MASAEKVDRLLELGITENQPSKVRGGMPGPSVYGEVHRDGKPFTQVVIYGSGEYRRAFNGIVTELIAAGAIEADAPVASTEGTILAQRKQFNEFLLAVNG